MKMLNKFLAKKNNEKYAELKNLEKEINEKRIYLNDINKDIKSLLAKKMQMQNECKTLERKLNQLEDNYRIIYKNLNKFTIEYVDKLNGLEFEQYIQELLSSIGYKNVIKTKSSNDYGIDILAEKEQIKYAIQCKNYNSPLGNSCVQEAYSGKTYYNCHIAVVITNSTFTKNAKELADKNGVFLWDRNTLKNMITIYKKNSQADVNSTNITAQKNNDDYDEPLYDVIVEYITQYGKASASLLQRKFKLGYNRASRCIELLEKNGIVDSAKGDKPREVLVKKE